MRKLCSNPLYKGFSCLLIVFTALVFYFILGDLYTVTTPAFDASKWLDATVFFIDLLKWLVPITLLNSFVAIVYGSQKK